MIESNHGNLYNRLHKKELVKQGEISCGFCRVHRGENRNYHFPRTDKYKNIDRLTLRKICEPVDMETLED